MQNYNQQAQGYQRPGSTASFAGQPGGPPQYGAAPQTFQSPAPTQPQWAPPTQNAAPIQQQWNQSPPQQNWSAPPPAQQQAQSGYNPGTYGAMPGAFNQGQTNIQGTPTTQAMNPSYPSQFQPQQQDNPPPPPPKDPHGFGANIQQQQHQSPQLWSQQSSFGTQQAPPSFQGTPQSTGFTPQGQQGDFNTQAQQGGFQQAQQPAFQGQTPQQQQYNSAVPPPPSQTPGGSYFPPAQGRPTSIYGADQGAQFSSPTSTQSPPNNIMSPNEQNPAYIPPSLSGQGVQSYMPVNTNPMPGVYVPPPPDIPAWQQAQHAPLQPGKSKFKYTKPIVHPNFHTQPQQGFQGGMGMQPPMPQPIQQPQPPVQQPMQQPIQPQSQFAQQQQPQLQQQFGQPMQALFQPQGQIQSQGQFGQPLQPMQPQQTQQQSPQTQPQVPFQQAQQPQQFGQMQQANQAQQPMQQFQAQGDGGQWNQGYGQPQQQNPSAPYGMQQPLDQQSWQSGQAAQVPVPAQNYGQGGQEQVIQAPKPINGQSQRTPPSFVSAAEPSPQSQPTSPVSQRQSVSFGSGQNASGLGRTGSVSSIALGALRRQQTLNDRTGSVPPEAPSPPSAPVAASALGAGGPSDWEHFGMIDEEIDDEEMFGAKKDDGSNQPQMLDSVELPVHPSPPPAQEWPTPEVQASTVLNVSPQRNDTYVPTPPLQAATLSTGASSEQPQAHQFVMDDSNIVSQSPQPPSSKPAFVMDSGEWDLPKQSSPTKQLNAPPANNTFIMGDGGWSQASNIPNVAPIKTDQPTTGFVMDDGGWGAAEQTPTQRTGGGIPLNQGLDHIAELKAKDEAYGRLQADTEREKDELRTQIKDAQAATEAAKSRAETDMEDWIHQVEQLKADVEKIRSDTSTKESDLKEKSATIERLNEDIEGKEKVIAEQALTIQDLRKQLREIAAPKPSDLIPDLDPWYASSLERFIAMLRQEASEAAVEDKIKTFTRFLTAESHARGLEYPAAPPAPSMSVSPAVHPQSTLDDHSAAISRVSSTKSFKKHDIQVTVPALPARPVYEEDADDAEYSPGGRPLIRRRQTFKSDDSIPTEGSFLGSSRPVEAHASMDFQQSVPHTIRTSVDSIPPRSGSTQGFNVRGSVGGVASEPSTQSTTILTPTSSTGDDFGKVVQSPPEPPSESSKPQYQPYVPGKVNHRQSMSFGTPSFQSGKSNKHDEIFFGEVQSQSTSKPSSRPTTSASNVPDVPIPAPLSLKTSSAVTKRSDSTLADLLPNQIVPNQPNARLETLRKQALALPADFSYIVILTKDWEKSAAMARAKNDRERQRRQEESESRATQLFDDNEISYADIGAMEDEFKEQEREKKGQEDREEYKSYVETVFDKVYDGLQDEIKTLMEIFVEAEGLLADSVCGKEALEAVDLDRPTTLQCMELLRELHDLVEIRHDRVVQSVAERDKRYKKTEIQPLYAAGNITKMKSVERHFENAEKQAALRAKADKADRVGDVVRICEEAVVRALSAEQAICDKILAAMKTTLTLVDEDEPRDALLLKAKDTYTALKHLSKSLLTIFNALELELNQVVLEAEIAHAKADGADQSRTQELEKELVEGERKLKEEFRKRVGVLDGDVREVEALVGGVEEGVDSEEEEREKRLRAALEEAKRRNEERQTGLSSFTE